MTAVILCRVGVDDRPINQWHTGVSDLMQVTGQLSQLVGPFLSAHFNFYFLG